VAAAVDLAAVAAADLVDSAAEALVEEALAEAGKDPEPELYKGRGPNAQNLIFCTFGPLFLIV
jgi:hypothetical protein